MSVEAHHLPDTPQDRRVKRTRSAILSAFNRLILQVGYAALTPGDIAKAADVGRSTFYEHFRGVDDLLGKALQPVLSPLVAVCFEPSPTAQAQAAVEHIWENRRVARLLLEGESQAVVLRSLASAFEAALARSPIVAGGKPMLGADLVAAQLAAVQVVVLSAWVSGRSGCSARDLTAVLHASGEALVTALMALSKA